jgi:hypothetical protein
MATAYLVARESREINFRILETQNINFPYWLGVVYGFRSKIGLWEFNPPRRVRATIVAVENQ